MCLENKQILQGAEEVHSQFPDLLQARSGSKEDYTTSHFSRLYWSSHYQRGPEKAKYLFVFYFCLYCFLKVVLLLWQDNCHRLKYASDEHAMLLNSVVCLTVWERLIWFVAGFRKTRVFKKPNPGGFFWGFIGFWVLMAFFGRAVLNDVKYTWKGKMTNRRLTVNFWKRTTINYLHILGVFLYA